MAGLNRLSVGISSKKSDKMQVSSFKREKPQNGYGLWAIGYGRRKDHKFVGLPFAFGPLPIALGKHFHALWRLKGAWGLNAREGLV